MLILFGVQNCPEEGVHSLSMEMPTEENWY